MEDCASFLHPTVSSLSKNLAAGAHKGTTDGNSSFGRAPLRFLKSNDKASVSYRHDELGVLQDLDIKKDYVAKRGYPAAQSSQFCFWLLPLQE